MSFTAHQFLTALTGLDPATPNHIPPLVDILDRYSTAFAADKQARQNIGNSTNPSIWSTFTYLWRQSLHAHMLPHPPPDYTPSLIPLLFSLAKFTRNLVAAVPNNQNAAFHDTEPIIRKLLYQYTSYTAIQCSDFYPLTRILTQALSNIVTDNPSLADLLWSTYINLPQEQSILIRLFASPDARTVSSAFVLMINCIDGSRPRIELLAEATLGPRTFLSYLDRMASLFQADEASEEGRAFDIGYELAVRVIEASILPRLYTKLTVDAEPITPHQTTLLKLLDSYLHSSPLALELSRQPAAHGLSLLDMLLEQFMNFSTYAQAAIQRALGSSSAAISGPAGLSTNTYDGDDNPARGTETETMSMNAPRAPSEADGDLPLQELDLLLPKVCEALVLVTQSLTTILLRAEEPDATPAPVSSHKDTGPLPGSTRTVVVAAESSTGQGLVECLIETLRLIDVFVPRMTYGKVVQRPTAPGPDVLQGGERISGSSSFQDKRNERGSPTATPEAGPGPQQAQVVAAQAFAYVKRDLVRLLGILASHDPAVQDRVRECGGIPVVMNLCVVDDYNPYLREHAIFALRNLLDRNLENQAVVEAVKPVGRWDENKVLQELRSDLAE